MGAKLQALLTLQQIELQIVDIRRQLARKERMVKAQTARLNTARQTVEQERTAAKHAQAKFDELDVDIKARTASVDRLREHLNTVRTNKEYAAVLSQLNNEKADISRLEASALEIMQGVEGQKSAISEHEQTRQAEAERLEDLQAQMQQTQESFSGRLLALEQQRADAACQIEYKDLEMFERLSERYDGEALAEVLRPNPRLDEFICGGCHMALRQEAANTLKVKDEVITCRSCGRILYIEKHT